MTYFFRLTLQESGTSPFLYKGEVDGTHEVFLILDEERAEIRPADSQGNPVESLRMSLSDGNISGTVSDQNLVKGFPLMAAHLLAQWKKQGHPPAEIRKFFA